MFVSLPVVDDVDCLRSDEAFTKITSSSTFCVGDGSGRSPCHGKYNFKDQEHHHNNLWSNSS